MRSPSIILLILALAASLLSSGQNAEPFEEGGKWGLKKNGQVILKPKLKKILPVMDGMMLFIKGSKYGYFDSTGTEVVPAIYFMAKPFVNGLAAVRTTKELGSGGYIDRTGKMVIQPRYSSLSPFRGSIALVQKAYGEYHSLCIIDKNENIVVDEVFDFKDYYRKYLYVGFYKYYQDRYAKTEQYVIVELSSGKIVSEELVDIYYFNKGPKIVERTSYPSFTIMDKSLKPLCDWYAEIEPIPGIGHYKVKDNKDLFGVLNNEYKLILPCEYKHIYSEGDIFTARKKDEIDEELFDLNGNKIAGPFNITDRFEDGVAVINVSGTENYHCFIDKKGQCISEKYRSLTYFTNGYAVAKNKEFKYAYVSREGKQISKWYDKAFIHFEPNSTVKPGDKFRKLITGGMKFATGLWVFTDVIFRDRSAPLGNDGRYDFSGSKFSDGLARVALTGEYTSKDIEFGSVSSNQPKFGFIDTTGKEVIACTYDMATDFENGVSWVKLDDKYGAIDTKGGIAVPLKYSSLGEFSEGLVSAQLNGNWGYIDASGKEVVSFKYEAASPFKKGIAEVKLDGVVQKINTMGEVVQ